MDKKIFDIVQKYHKLTNDAYKKLDEMGIEMDALDDVFQGFDEYYSELLQIGKYSDDAKVLEKETYTINDYEDIKSYTKITVIYEYDNGMNLCISSDGTHFLIPKSYLAEY